MALNNSYANTIKKTRVYKLCRVCNLQGRKGNPLVNCIICCKHVHSTNSCSSTSIANNNIVDTIDNKINNESRLICPLCKAGKRNSINSIVPTNSSSKRHSSQSKTTIGGRGSTFQVDTPPCITLYTTGWDARSSGSPTLTSSVNNTTGTVISQLDYQKYHVKLNESVNELKILCTKNNTQINILKQENQ